MEQPVPCGVTGKELNCSSSLIGKSGLLIMGGSRFKSYGEHQVRVAKLVDAADLSSAAILRVGSSPTPDTSFSFGATGCFLSSRLTHETDDQHACGLAGMKPVTG